MIIQLADVPIGIYKVSTTLTDEHDREIGSNGFTIANDLYVRTYTHACSYVLCGKDVFEGTILRIRAVWRTMMAMHCLGFCTRSTANLCRRWWTNSACMYPCACAHMYMHMYECKCIRVSMCTRVHACMHACVHAHVCVHACTRVVLVRVLVRAFVCWWVQVCVHECMRACMDVCTRRSL